MTPSTSRRLNRRYWDANQISIISISIITMISVIGIIVCVMIDKTNVGTLDTIVAAGLGALAMYVRPLPAPAPVQRETTTDA